MSYWVVAGLALIMALVLLLPFSVKRVEEELEIFLLVMGCARYNGRGRAFARLFPGPRGCSLRSGKEFLCA